MCCCAGERVQQRKEARQHVWWEITRGAGTPDNAIGQQHWDLWCYMSKPGNQSRSCFPLPRRSHSHSVLSSQQLKKTEDRRSSSAVIISMPLKPIMMGPISLLLQIKWLRLDIVCRTRSANSIRQDRLMRYLLKREWLTDKLLVRLKRSIGLIVCNINAAVLIIYLHC